MQFRAVMLKFGMSAVGHAKALTELGVGLEASTPNSPSGSREEPPDGASTLRSEKGLLGSVEGVDAVDARGSSDRVVPAVARRRRITDREARF